MSIPADVAAVVARAETVLAGALDTLRPHLLAASGDVEVTSKADGTPVTTADLDADEQLSKAITAAFPEHGILSEEQETVAPDAEFCWVIDPIDGTSNFITGLPYWCVSVALTHRGRTLFGVVDAPPLDARYTATLGGGARCNGRDLHVRDVVAFDDPRQRHVPLMLTTSTARRARGSGIRLNPRVMGATALDMCLVAEGVAAGSLAVIPHIWDVAAGSLLVSEAGGVVVTVSGEPLLPLVPGTDYLGRDAVTAAGSEEAWVHEVASRLLAR